MKREEESVEMEQSGEQEQEEKDTVGLHLQSTSTSTRKKPTASPFPGFYGEKPAPKKTKKAQGTAKMIQMEKINKLEKFMIRFKRILLKHKHQPERLKDKQKN